MAVVEIETAGRRLVSYRVYAGPVHDLWEYNVRRGELAKVDLCQLDREHDMRWDD